MAPPKIIIDTDPGIDDVLAISLALSQSKTIEVPLIASTHGNTDLIACHRNVVCLLGVLGETAAFRKASRLPELSFEKPIVAMGANKPIIKAHGHGQVDPTEIWEGYHGTDGLNGFHSKHPEYVPKDFLDFFQAVDGHQERRDVGNYIASSFPAYVEILDQLRSNPPQTIDLVILGPGTNAALALEADPETFCRVKSIVMMGGALRHAGNQTPRAEFNIYGDPDAAARLFNLTSPSRLTKRQMQVPFYLIPLDITSYHILSQDVFTEYLDPWIRMKDPLAGFLREILVPTFEKIERISGNRAVGCHDPLTIYALLHPDLMTWETMDVRVETEGFWTRGETVIDTRGRKRWAPGSKGATRDNGNWLHGDSGNCVNVLVSSGDDGTLFGLKLLRGMFGETKQISTV